MDDLKEAVTEFLAALTAIVAVDMALATPTMLLWNEIMPRFFGVPEFTFWNGLAFNLFVSLIAFLFRGANVWGLNES